MKGPTVSLSDNLNPWHWKRERAPRFRNTTPSALHSDIDFERMASLESHQESVPQVIAAVVAPQKDIAPLTVAETVLSPAALETVLAQESGLVTANNHEDVGPQVQASELVPLEIAATLQTRGSLPPSFSEDQLKDYIERYFLKQDGYDDP